MTEDVDVVWNYIGRDPRDDDFFWPHQDAIDALRRLDRKLTMMRDGLERILGCDYRGNEPPEQAIARRVLAEVSNP